MGIGISDELRLLVTGSRSAQWSRLSTAYGTRHFRANKKCNPENSMLATETQDNSFLMC